jgi:hypothetical protein
MSGSLNLARAVWVKSSYSNANEGQCLEFAPAFAATTGLVPVRDSKRPADRPLLVPARAWGAFAATVACGSDLRASD